MFAFWKVSDHVLDLLTNLNLNRKDMYIAFLCDVFLASSPRPFPLVVDMQNLLWKIENLWQPGIPDQWSNYLLNAKFVHMYFVHAWKIPKKYRCPLESVAKHYRSHNTLSANFQELLFEKVCNALDFCSSVKSNFCNMCFKLIIMQFFLQVLFPQILQKQSYVIRCFIAYLI